MRANRRDSAFLLHFGLLVGPKHERNVRPVNVAIEQANAISHLVERERQIHGERGLADSAFAGTNGNDRVNAR